jgi:hypothetical protein
MTAYLGQHPDIFIPPLREKDVPFFGQDLDLGGDKESMEEYLGFYEPALPSQRAGEACVWYLYSETVPGELHDFSPDSQILAFIRNPVDLVYSLHSQLVYTQDEDVLDFEEALQVGQERQEGRRSTPVTGRVPQLSYFYMKMGEYVPHLARYLEHFGRDQVSVFIYEDIRNDTRAVLDKVFGVLGVDPDVPVDIRVINANQVARSSLAQRVIQTHPKSLVRMFRAVTPERLHGKLYPAVARLNTRYETRAPMAPELRQRLQERFRPDVEELSELLDRDLVAEWFAG